MYVGGMSWKVCNSFLPATKQVICSVLNEDNFLKSKAAQHCGSRIFSVKEAVQCLYDQHILRGQKSSRVGKGIQQFGQVP